jgi:hypothetical protein
MFVVRNTSTRRVVIDSRVEAGEAVDNSAVRFLNCVFDNRDTGSAPMRLCVRNHADNLINNGYRGLVNSDDAAKGYDEDTRAVTLGSAVNPGAMPYVGDPLYENGYPDNELRLEYDQNWNLRDMQKPTIGPVAPVGTARVKHQLTPA